MRKFRSTGQAVLTVALTATAVAGLPALASASSAGAAPVTASHHAIPKPDANGCYIFENLTESVLWAQYDDAAPAGYSVGDHGAFKNKLETADGKVVAYADGTSDAKLIQGSSLWTLEKNVDILPGLGAVREIGMMDATELAKGHNISVYAEGVSGKLRGKVGLRSFTKTGDKTYLSALWLC